MGLRLSTEAPDRKLPSAASPLGSWEACRRACCCGPYRWRAQKGRGECQLDLERHGGTIYLLQLCFLLTVALKEGNLPAALYSCFSKVLFRKKIGGQEGGHRVTYAHEALLIPPQKSILNLSPSLHHTFPLQSKRWRL